MKVSRRELILLIALLCAGIAYLLYAFVYAPMLRNISLANENLYQRQLRLSSYEQMVAQYDVEKLQAEQQTRLEEVEATAKPLLPYIDDGEITTFINQLAAAQSIYVSNVVFNTVELYDTATAADYGAAMTYPLKQAADAYRMITEGAPVQAEPETALGTDPNADPTALDQTPSVVNKLTVSIQLDNVTYPQIIAFMKQLEAKERSILLNRLVISEETGGNLKASLVYNFMQADKLTDADKGLAEVVGAQGTGKNDPFVFG